MDFINDAEAFCMALAVIGVFLLLFWIASEMKLPPEE